MKPHTEPSLTSGIIGTIARSCCFFCPSQLCVTLRKYTEPFHTCCHPRALQCSLVWLQASQSIWRVADFRWQNIPNLGIPALVALGCCSVRASRNQVTQADTNRLTGDTKHWGLFTINWWILMGAEPRILPLWVWNCWQNKALGLSDIQYRTIFDICAQEHWQGLRSLLLWAGKAQNRVAIAPSVTIQWNNFFDWVAEHRSTNPTSFERQFVFADVGKQVGCLLFGFQTGECLKTGSFYAKEVKMLYVTA